MNDSKLVCRKFHNQVVEEFVKFVRSMNHDFVKNSIFNFHSTACRKCKIIKINMEYFKEEDLESCNSNPAI